MSYEERVRQLTEAAGSLAPIGDDLVATLRPSVRLVTDGPGRASRRSHLGGQPDVPAGFSWPTWTVTSTHWLRPDKVSEQPLDFIAQVDLADIASVAEGHDLGIPDLPTAGLLLFFLDVDTCTGLTPDERAGFHVAHVPEDATTHAATAPAGAEEFPEIPIRLRVEPTVANIQRFAAGREVEDGAHEAVEEVLYPVGPLHRIGGHPDPIQGPVETDAALALAGAFVKGSGVDTQAVAADAEARDTWRLLLQVDSDGAMMWGDAGMLYWLVDTAGEGSFTDRISPAAQPPQLWHLMQCH